MNELPRTETRHRTRCCPGCCYGLGLRAATRMRADRKRSARVACMGERAHGTDVKTPRGGQDQAALEIKAMNSNELNHTTSEGILND